jgi:hypothetical protein
MRIEKNSNNSSAAKIKPTNHSAFEPPWRWNSCEKTSWSPQISLSKAPPLERKCPTTVQSFFCRLTFCPTSRPGTRSAMRSPTMISSRPGLKLRPLVTVTPPRTSKTLGVTPRNFALRHAIATTHQRGVGLDDESRVMFALAMPRGRRQRERNITLR